MTAFGLRKRPAASLALIATIVLAMLAAFLVASNRSEAATGRTTAADHPTAPPSPTVSAWVTAAQPGTPQISTYTLAAYPPATRTATEIRVSGSVGFQQVTGFGAALTDSSAHMLYELTPDVRSQVMRQLFDPRSGAGISFLRAPIGASDFVVGADYSFDDMPPGQTDYQMKHFSIAHDEAQILPLFREALRLNPKLSIVASPWSPPGWMKTTDSMIDGTLIDTPAIYHAYALYLVKFLLAYQQAGVPVDYITVQNEPQALDRDNYPGTDMDWQQEAKVIDALGPMIKAAGLKTKILGYDHNWGTHWGDVASHEAVNENPQVNYPYNLLESSAAQWISGTAYHCYYGDPSAQTQLKASFPSKDIFETECEGGDISTAMGVLNNWGKSVIDWNIALDQNNGPHLGGCGTCNGTITINSTTHAVTYNAQYYMLAHFAKFVEPGATRIASVTTNTQGANVPIQTVAFRNPDHTIALVVWNSSSTASQTYSVIAGGKYIEATLGAGDIATYTWQQAATG